MGARGSGMRSKVSMPRLVKIKVDDSGMGSLCINGVDISHVVRGFSLAVQAGKAVNLTISLSPYELEIEADCVVQANLPAPPPGFRFKLKHPLDQLVDVANERDFERETRAK